MTAPSGYTPPDAISSTGLAAFAVKTQSDWQNEYHSNIASKYQPAADGAYTMQANTAYANSQLTASLTSDVGGGVAVNDVFNGAASSSLGANWTQTYSGAGAGTLGLDGGGFTKWNKSGGSARRCIAHYNTALTTNYQRVRAVLFEVPEAAYFGNWPSVLLCGRVNAANTSYVYAAVAATGFGSPFQLEIGCAVAGSLTSFKQSTSFTPAVGDVYDFYIGTNVSDYELIVKRNGVELDRYTDTGPVSQKGASYLYAGTGVQAQDRSFSSDQSLPGAITAWAAIDRLNTSY